MRRWLVQLWLALDWDNPGPYVNVRDVSRIVFVAILIEVVIQVIVEIVVSVVIKVVVIVEILLRCGWVSRDVLSRNKDLLLRVVVVPALVFRVVVTIAAIVTQRA